MNKKIVPSHSIKEKLFNVAVEPSRWEILGCVLIIVLAHYMIAPRFWEPGGESLKNWVGAQIFRETLGFPVFSIPPLYNLYLQVFLSFDYPLSIQLEHFVTHLFAHTSIFLLLRRFLPIIPALLLTCAWIPTLWIVQSPARVMGIAFLALYFGSRKKSPLNKGYLPISLGAAALCEAGYIVFLLGHVIGTLVKRCSSNEPILPLGTLFRQTNIFPTAIKFGMILLVIMTISFQSERPDNNVYQINYPWVPISHADSMPVAYFQEGNWRYAMQNCPRSEWYKQDWYLTHEKAFGGAQSVVDGLIYNPDIFTKAIIENLPQIIMLPAMFMVGFTWHGTYIMKILLIISYFMLPICVYSIFRFYDEQRFKPVIYSIVFGVSGIIVTTAPLFFRIRYIVVLLPVGLMFAAHIGKAIQSLTQSLRNSLANRDNSISFINKDSVGHKILFYFGILFIVVGLSTNEWILTWLFPRVSNFGLANRIAIWCFNLALIFGGVLIIKKRNFFLATINEIKGSSYPNTQSWFTNAITLFMVGCLLLFSFQQHGKNFGIFNLMENPFLLSGNMAGVHQQLLASVNKNSKVLALEEPWIRAFADVHLDNVYHALYLPPFEDKTGKTEKFLGSLDVIWISNNWAREVPSMGTQGYLRYGLHVKPFLEKATVNGWTVQEVEGYGKIYRKPISE